MLSSLVLSLSLARGFALADETGEPLVILSEEISSSVEDYELASSATADEEIHGVLELAASVTADEFHDMLSLIEGTDFDVIGAALCQQNDNKFDCLDQDLGDSHGWCIWHGVYGFCEYIVQGESEVEINERLMREGRLHEGLNVGDIFMGDIEMDESTREEYGLSTMTDGEGATPQRRAFYDVGYVDKRWPSRTMPYFFHSSVTESQQKIITDALLDITYDTGGCMLFKHVENSAEKADACMFASIAGAGCSVDGYGRSNNQKTYLGETARRRIQLQPNGCYTRGIIQHEIMHALGFGHEMQRPDRDAYVTINTHNIGASGSHDLATMMFNFDIPSSTQIIAHPYDYLSLMHYGRYSSSVNGDPTIETTESWARNEIGQKIGISSLDAEDIKANYCPVANYYYGGTLITGCSYPVRLYNHSSGSGTPYKNFYNGKYNLSSYGWDNKVSSVRVYPGCKAILYENKHGLGGGSVTLSVGTWTRSDLQNLGFPNNAASHLVVLDETADYSDILCTSAVTTTSSNHFSGFSDSYGVSAQAQTLARTVSSIRVPQGCHVAFGPAGWCSSSYKQHCKWFAPGDYDLDNPINSNSYHKIYVFNLSVDGDEFKRRRLEDDDDHMQAP